MRPTKANLECADVILERNRLDPRAWQSLRRDIAIAITITERQKPWASSPMRQNLFCKGCQLKNVFTELGKGKENSNG